MNKNRTVGVLTGKFAPLHNGHIFMINQAATQVDMLYVVLSYDDKFLKEQPDNLRDRLTKTKRTLWLKKTFGDLPHIKIVVVDESRVPPYPEGVQLWSDLVWDALGAFGVSKIDKWFSSEPDYSNWIKKHFNTKHVVVDAGRSTFPVSGTEVRKNIFKFWDMLPSIVRKDFIKKVVIIGTDSCGKSTLIKYLSKLYGTSWVEEYGRTFCEVDMCGDESLLAPNDYALIAARRYLLEQEALLTGNRVVFCDTNAFVTQYYSLLYTGTTNPVVEGYIDIEEYDLVLHLDDSVEWVDDGLRTGNDRAFTRNFFESVLEDYKVKEGNYHLVTGSYNERLMESMKLIDNLFKHLTP